MKTKQLLILLGILVVLVVIVGLVENPFAKSEYAKKVEAATPLFPNFDKESVTKIEIKRVRGNNNPREGKQSVARGVNGELSRRCGRCRGRS